MLVKETLEERTYRVDGPMYGREGGGGGAYISRIISLLTDRWDYTRGAEGLYPGAYIWRAYIRGLISGSLNPGVYTEGLYLGFLSGAYIWSLISGGLYLAA